MGEMIERVALAIADAMCPVEGYRGTSNEALARAAIEAMREPTREMLGKGITAAEDVEDWTRDSYTSYRVDTASDMALPVWQAMIDAALSPESPGLSGGR